MQRWKCAWFVPGGCFAALILVLVTIWAILPAASLAAPEASPRIRAITLARDGDYQDALEILHREHLAHPVDLDVFHDYLTVLSWSGRDTEVFAMLSRFDENRAPAYVLEAAAKSLRNLKAYPWAQVLYDRGQERFPDQIAFPLGSILTLTDSGRLQEAADRAEELVSRYPREVEPLFAAAYVAKARGDQVAALARYQRILELQPENRKALKLQALALADLGAPFLAEEMAGREQNLLTEAERERLRADQAALTVRWGRFDNKEKARFVDTDRALQMLDKNLQMASQAGPEARLLELRTRFDRLVALRDRVRMREAAEEYRKLQDAGVDLPPYALEAAADALLYLEEPEEARDVYLQVLDKDPAAFEAQIGLFYAYVEGEDFTSAAELIQKVRAQQAPQSSPFAASVPQDKAYRLEADLTAAVGQSLAGNCREAEKRLTALHRRAPANPEIQGELGDVYAARGWYRRAEETYRLGLGLDPRDLGLRIGWAENRLDLAEFRQAGQVIGDLRADYPENKAVQRLDRLWGSHNLRELILRADSGWSSGSTFGSHDLTVETTLFSAPVFYHYRGFVADYLRMGDFPEGDETWQRLGAGVEYQGRNLRGNAELTWNLSGGRKLGGRLGGDWQIDDNWSLPFSLEIFSRNTPLRAVKHGIRADEVSSGLVWRQNELRSAYLTLQALDFTDGNFRYGVAAGLAQRLVTRPHYLLTAYLDLASSGNSRTDVPYYSPDQDAECSLTLENDWLLWRRYNRSFRHRLALSGGGYWQQDFGTSAVGGVRYEHLWEFFPRFSLLYGVSWRHAVYDGDGENRIGVHLELNWRF